VALLHQGALAAVGTPADVLTAEMLNNTYGVAGEIISLGQGTYFCPVHQTAASPNSAGY
jgi:ABC-type hemin transport system ATPase subunit